VKSKNQIASARRLTLLLLFALLVALVPLSHLTDGETHAQSDTTPKLPAPVLTVVSMSADTVQLSWTAVLGTARYKPRAIALEDEYIHFA